MLVLVHACWALACAAVLLFGDDPSRLVVVAATLVLLGRALQRTRHGTAGATVPAVSWDDVLQHRR